MKYIIIFLFLISQIFCQMFMSNWGITSAGNLSLRLMTNKTGTTSIRGQVMQIGPGDYCVSKNTNQWCPIFGVMYSIGIADGQACYIAVAGTCQVLLASNTYCTNRNVVFPSTNGDVIANTLTPTGGWNVSSSDVASMLGLCLQTTNSVGVTNVLVWIELKNR